MRRIIQSLLIATIIFPAALAAAASHPFTVEDLVAMKRVSDPQPSPDGTRVAFVVTTMDLKANHGRSDIWVVGVDGSRARRLTTNAAADWNPRWRDDGTLYFLSTRSGSAQVWRLSFSGGEAQQVTSLPIDVDNLTVGPTGGALFVSAAIYPDCEDPVPCTVQRRAEKRAAKASGMIYDHLFVRHWDTWEDGTFNHILRIPLGADGLPAGPALDLMKGVASNSPTKPWGGSEDYTVSPDGRWLVYCAKAVTGSEVAWSTNYDLYAVPTDGSATRRDLTADNPAWDAAPTFSPDGKTVAYLAMKRPGYESDRFRVALLDWPAGSRKLLTESWDRSPSDLVWAADGRTLLATADNVGNHSIFSVDAGTGQAVALVTRHSNTSPRPLAHGRLVYSQDSLVSPAELYLLPRAGGEPQRLTHLNDDHLAQLRFGTYQQFSFIGAHGDEVFGYLLHPADFNPKQTYPLAFLIHGGPQGSFDDHFHYRWNPEIYAAHGYATVMIDFHGSTGYGQAFTDAINGDWGGAPYEDLMRGLDDVLRRHPWIDANRMAALGASFGGYMINWVQGHTDRFKALVCHDGNLDEYMAYFDTEELWFPEWEHGGTPWDNPDGYRKQSPVAFVKNWKTPELVIHGAHDYRVADTQGLATFNALQRLGVPSRLLYYPDESHWVLKPQNSIQWHHVVLDWIDRWTAPPAPTPTPTPTPEAGSEKGSE